MHACELAAGTQRARGLMPPWPHQPAQAARATAAAANTPQAAPRLVDIRAEVLIHMEAQARIGRMQAESHQVEGWMRLYSFNVTNHWLQTLTTAVLQFMEYSKTRLTGTCVKIR